MRKGRETQDLCINLKKFMIKYCEIELPANPTFQNYHAGSVPKIVYSIQNQAFSLQFDTLLPILHIIIEGAWEAWCNLTGFYGATFNCCKFLFRRLEHYCATIWVLHSKTLYWLSVFVVQIHCELQLFSQEISEHRPDSRFAQPCFFRARRLFSVPFAALMVWFGIILKYPRLVCCYQPGSVSFLKCLALQ